MTASSCPVPSPTAGDPSSRTPAAVAARARSALPELPYAARPRVRRALAALEDATGERAHALARRLDALLVRACADAATRAALIGPVAFDGGLPIHAHLDALAAAIRTHPVVVVSGATGSGKTTQLPKLCLALGRGRLGRIGHTQPRRIAARAVAARLAAELGANGPALVGHKVRFADHTPPTAAIKLLTDGMLLAESRADPWLREYDTLIVDEAHERSLNIDLLLGRLRTLLARRPELKVLIASATLEPSRIAAYFGGAPLIEVSGRSHPVEIRYRPPGPDQRDASGLARAVTGAVAELRREGPGDVLVFLPGEREIRECAQALRGARLPDTEVLALYARQSRAEQDRVFRPRGTPRVVLATNVAETSLTVPGVRYVVDSGLARIARYSASGRMARLPVEPIAQASAIQRAGRCGRLGPGVCVRLYEEADFARRPAFPEPEILRAPLAETLLQMLDLGLDPQRFPFLDAPQARQLREAQATLYALGAVDADGRLTALGRRLADFPLDPRLARMLVEAERTGALAEVLVIVAGLSVPDVRVRPHDAAERADQRHRAFADPRSDFLTLLALYRGFEQAARGHSQRKARAWCEEHDLSYARAREWREVESQLRTLAHEAGLRAGEPGADYAAIHRALLAGLLDRVALREEAPPPGRRRAVPYRAARGARVYLHPGAGPARRAPRWVMAAEVVETTRAYARTVAAIEPGWIEPLAGHLLRREYLEPHFDAGRQEIAAFERVTLFGLPVVARRRVRYARVDPAGARALFLREGLVGERLETPSPGVARSRARVAAVRTLEAKTRRAGLLADDEALLGAWEARIPPGIASAYTFEHWRARAEAADPQRLVLREDEVRAADAPAVSEAAYPDTWPAGGVALPLCYRFEPGHEADGITLRVPLALLPALDADALEWLVPGWRAELLAALIRSLPKALRRRCVPAPDLAQALARRLAPSGPVRAALAAALTRHTGTEIRAADFDPAGLPEHLRIRVEVVDAHGALLAQGRDAGALQAALGERARAAFAQRPRHQLEREGISAWDFGALAETIELAGPAGLALRGYPALVDAGRGCALRVLESPAAAALAHRGGVNALLRARLAREHPALAPRAAALGPAAVHYAPLGRSADLERELAAAIVEAAFLEGSELPRDGAAFEALWQQGLARVPALTAELTTALARTLAAYGALRRALREGGGLALVDVHADLAAQLEDLVHPGFVAATGPAQLAHLPRYLQAMVVRLERARTDPARDRAARAVLAPYLEALRAQPEAVRAQPRWQRLRWLVEELRVSLFAQELGTAEPVSPARLDRAWEALAS